MCFPQVLSITSTLSGTEAEISICSFLQVRLQGENRRRKPEAGSRTPDAGAGRWRWLLALAVLRRGLPAAGNILCLSYSVLSGTASLSGPGGSHRSGEAPP